MIYEMNDELSAQILTNLLDNTDPEIDVREGSPMYTLQAPNADEFTNLYAEFQAVRDETFIIDENGEISMFGNRLDKWVNMFGIERKAGGKSTGTVTISADEDTLVPAGTQLFAPATFNVLFETDVEVTATPAGAPVAVTAVFEGLDGNVSTNSITGVIGNLEGIIHVTNNVETAGGFDEESDEELGSRYLNYMRRPAASGNANDYYQWATSIPGIQEALVIPIWNGPGTVKVKLLSNDHRAPTPEKIAEVAAYIEENRPIDANSITVEGADEIIINVTADVSITGDLVTIQSEFEQVLRNHLEMLDFEKGDLVRVTRTQNILLDTEGVVDFTNFTINAGTANVPIPPGAVALLGTVTLNEVV